MSDTFDHELDAYESYDRWQDDDYCCDSYICPDESFENNRPYIKQLDNRPTRYLPNTPISRTSNARASNNMDDLDAMPFGKHKGKPMQDVPASYLNWLFHEMRKDPTKNDDPVFGYIMSNLNALAQENPDLIW